MEIFASVTGRVDGFREMGCKVSLAEMERYGTNLLKELQLIGCYVLQQISFKCSNARTIKEIKDSVILFNQNFCVDFYKNKRFRKCWGYSIAGRIENEYLVHVPRDIL